MELERRGVPTVTFATEHFRQLAELTAKFKGAPGLRLVILPADLEYHADDPTWNRKLAIETLPTVVEAITTQV